MVYFFLSLFALNSFLLRIYLFFFFALFWHDSFIAFAFCALPLLFLLPCPALSALLFCVIWFLYQFWFCLCIWFHLLDGIRRNIHTHTHTKCPRLYNSFLFLGRILLRRSMVLLHLPCLVLCHFIWMSCSFTLIPFFIYILIFHV